MGDLPDWLGLGIAVVGLFGGGYSGARAGTVSRLRLEERRRILDDYWTFVALGSKGAPKDLFDCEALYGHSGPEAVEAARFWTATWAIDSLMLRLPWLDRAVWRDVRRAEGEQTRSCEKASIWRIEQARPGTASGEEIRAAGSSMRDSWIEANLWSNDERNQAASRAEHHLQRNLRNGLLLRLGNFTTGWRALRAGHRPWHFEFTGLADNKRPDHKNTTRSAQG